MDLETETLHMWVSALLTHLLAEALAEVRAELDSRRFLSRQCVNSRDVSVTGTVCLLHNNGILIGLAVSQRPPDNCRPL